MKPSVPLTEAGARRRRLLLAGGALGMLGTVAVTPVHATPESLAAAIAAFTGGAPLQSGRITLDIAKLIDNGNVVPVTISVDAPSASVRAIALFTERNPLPEVVSFTLSPMLAKPVVSTRMRLATSQKITAVAKMTDGSCYAVSANPVVTLAACLEGEG